MTLEVLKALAVILEFCLNQVTRIYLSKCKKLLSLANQIQVVEL